MVRRGRVRQGTVGHGLARRGEGIEGVARLSDVWSSKEGMVGIPRWGEARHGTVQHGKER